MPSLIRACVVRVASACVVLIAAVGPASAGGVPGELILHNFAGSGDNEWYPVAAPLVGAGGVLYGTTSGNSGTTSNGTVFSLTPPATSGGAWRERMLYAFGGDGDGAFPDAAVIADQAGRLYGTTRRGGSGGGCGTVFRLTPNAGGTAWTHSILHSFACPPNDGQNPLGSLLLDRDGALYGTTGSGGSAANAGAGWGTVFKLSPPATAAGAWTESILYRFQGGLDGAYPTAALLAGPGGSLLGTTSAGGGGCGSSGCGTAFRLTPPSASGGAWSETVLHRFTGGADGAVPLATLATDATGRIFGTTSAGGVVAAPGTASGTVFCLTPPTAADAPWPLTTLYTFASAYDGASPQAGVIATRAGVLYGTTGYTGSNGAGTVFRLTPPSGGTAWHFSVLHGFGGPNDGAKPLAGLAAGKNGTLYGTTFFGNAQGSVGTVFAVSQ